MHVNPYLRECLVGASHTHALNHTHTSTVKGDYNYTIHDVLRESALLTNKMIINSPLLSPKKAHTVVREDYVTLTIIEGNISYSDTLY